MPRLSPRKFTLLDTMILIAATAIGLAIVVDSCESDTENGILFRVGRGEDDRAFVPSKIKGGWTLAAMLRHSPYALQLLPPILVIWSVALLTLQAVPPRPRFRRVILQPGVIACVAGILSVSGAATWRLWLNGTIGLWNHDIKNFRPFWMINRAPMEAQGYAAFGIAFTWGILAAGRQLHPERDWIDRFGRIIGALWIVAVLAYWWKELELTLTA